MFLSPLAVNRVGLLVDAGPSGFEHLERDAFLAERNPGAYHWYGHSAPILIPENELAPDAFALDGTLEPLECFGGVWLRVFPEMCRFWCIHSSHPNMQRLVL